MKWNLKPSSQPVDMVYYINDLFMGLPVRSLFGSKIAHIYFSNYKIFEWLGLFKEKQTNKTKKQNKKQKLFLFCQIWLNYRSSSSVTFSQYKIIFVRYCSFVYTFFSDSHAHKNLHMYYPCAFLIQYRNKSLRWAVAHPVPLVNTDLRTKWKYGIL